MTSTQTATATTAVEFASPMPGLAPYTAFTLEAIVEADGLFALRSTDADVRLFLLEPVADEYGYAPRIPSGILSDVGAASQDETRLFVVANPAEDGVFLNLRAPVVMHRESGRAAQVILEDQSYPLRVPLGS